MKVNKTYGQKSCGITNLKVNSDTRTVEGVFADFNFIDSDGDLLSKDCCVKSIQEHGPGTNANRKIAHLAFHDVTRPVGVLDSLKVNEAGQLQFKSTLGTHTEGQDALKMYKEGIVREHSIGFKYQKFEFVSVDLARLDQFDAKNDIEAIKREGGYFDVKEIQLFEGSFVTFGANSNTPNMSIIKSQQDLNNEMEKLFERMDILNRALVDGTYRKNYNEMFSVELEQIKSSIKSLVTFDPNEKIKPIKSDEQTKSEQDEEAKKQYYLNKLR